MFQAKEYQNTRRKPFQRYNAQEFAFAREQQVETRQLILETWAEAFPLDLMVDRERIF